MSDTYKKHYGWSHQKARAIAKANLVEGTLCWRCGRPMYRRQKLHLDHVIPVSRGGASGPTRLAHAYCNVAAGNRQRLRRPRSNVRSHRRALPKW